MNIVNTNPNKKFDFSVLNLQQQKPTEMGEVALNTKTKPFTGENSSSYVNQNNNIESVRVSELTARGINNAVGLLQSIDGSASVIQDKLIGMKSIAMEGTGCACQRIRKAQESITSVVNNFSWNGINFMEGGGENDQNTTLLSLNVSANDSEQDDLRLDFKSFNPMSAVDTDGEVEPIAPNLPDLNKSEGTDTHAYGDAAMYSSPDKNNYLHVHSKLMKDNAIIQLDRAISGVMAERARLAGYLKKLDLIASTNQRPNNDSRKDEQTIFTAEYANQVADFSKNEILDRADHAMSTQLNRIEKKLSALLH